MGRRAAFTPEQLARQIKRDKKAHQMVSVTRLAKHFKCTAATIYNGMRALEYELKPDQKGLRGKLYIAYRGLITARDLAQKHRIAPGAVRHHLRESMRDMWVNERLPYPTNLMELKIAKEFDEGEKDPEVIADATGSSVQAVRAYIARK